MSEKKVHVWIDLAGKTIPVGQLWSRRHTGGRESSSFQYHPEWLKSPERFALESALALTEGTFHTENDRSLFGAMGDSAPDRWGRMLMRREEARRAKAAGEQARNLHEIDYLLGVNDEARQGALRFSFDIDSDFLAHSSTNPIPPVLTLPKLLSATEHLLNKKESDADLKLLLAPGSSLGGARPKASVRDTNHQLAIAKFPSKDDEFSNTQWEAVALSLAAKAGVQIPTWRLENISKKPVLIVERFDRVGKNRIPFLSAMSMIGAKDNESHSYLELVDALHRYGAAPKKDIPELWRRIVFTILISNTDDHLRNHGFLYHSSKGWSLSPAYDLNPTPLEIKPRVLSTAIDLHNTSASLDVAFSVVHEFGIKMKDAKIIAKQVGAATALWRQTAKSMKIPSNEIERMASAFEHEDLKQALA